MRLFAAKLTSPMRHLFALIALLLATVAGAATPALPYDEQADAHAAVQRALAQAQAAHVPVLLILGANWCGDCRALDQAMHSEANAKLLAAKFKVVKVDVGNFDRNLDIAAAYGNPIKKGIPAAVVLSPDNQVLYATRGGELANARRMSETGITEFFERVSRAH